MKSSSCHLLCMIQEIVYLDHNDIPLKSQAEERSYDSNITTTISISMSLISPFLSSFLLH